MKILELAKAFTKDENNEPILIFCSKKDIDKLFLELSNLSSKPFYEVKIDRPNIAEKLGIQSCFVEGKEIHFIPSENKSLFFQLMSNKD